MSLMFLATRTRPDILKECTFLTSFGCNPGENSIKKLERVYGYVRNTIEFGIILGADSYRLKLYTDAAYALHVKGRSHTGLVITFDGEPISGPVYCKSHMQKISYLIIDRERNGSVGRRSETTNSVGKVVGETRSDSCWRTCISNV